MQDIYDIVIVGGGPAGLTAALYACRARMKVVLVEKMLCGGQILVADTIENYPGFPEGIKGPDLADWMQKQAEHFGLKVKTDEVSAIEPKKDKNDLLKVRLQGGDILKARALIMATGARWNALGIPGEKELTGRGVSYCATCDGPLFRDKEIVVIGGGDTALEDALFLTKFANKVTIVHRRDKLRATKILQERALANKKIEFRLDSVPVEIKGSSKVETVAIKNVRTAQISEVRTDGVFVLIGVTPNSDIVSRLVTMDEKKCVITDDRMRTSADGIFACGDIRQKLLRQVVTAAGDGATAAFSAEQYVESLKQDGE